MNHISQKYWGQAGFERLLANPKAIIAVFLRDPVDRFVSAFFSKCIHCDVNYKKRRDQACRHCHAEQWDNQGPPTFSKTLRWGLSINLETLTDVHWKLQSSHCHFDTMLRAFNVIGFMGPSFKSDTNCLLEMAGLAQYSTAQPDSGSTHEHSSRDPYLVLKKVFTPTSGKALIKHMQADYRMFGFDSTPPWLSQATGEWSELTAYQLCQVCGVQCSSSCAKDAKRDGWPQK
jgi:hypothetical protein